MRARLDTYACCWGSVIATDACFPRGKPTPVSVAHLRWHRQMAEAAEERAVRAAAAANGGEDEDAGGDPDAEAELNAVAVASNIIEYYAVRPATITGTTVQLDSVTLFNFVQHYEVTTKCPARRPSAEIEVRGAVRYISQRSTPATARIKPYMTAEKNGAEYYYVQLLLHKPWSVPRGAVGRGVELETYNECEHEAVLGGPGIEPEQAFQEAAGQMQAAMEMHDGAERLRAEVARINALNGDFVADDFAAVLGNAAAGGRFRDRHLGADAADDLYVPPDGADDLTFAAMAAGGGVPDRPAAGEGGGAAAAAGYAGGVGWGCWSAVVHVMCHLAAARRARCTRARSHICPHRVLRRCLLPSIHPARAAGTFSTESFGERQTDEVWLERNRNLSPDQRAVFELVRSHIRSTQQATSDGGAPPTPLSLFVTGGAGTGKSFFIEQVAELIRRAHPSLSSPVLLLAPTGVAAFNIGGSTMHNALQLPVERGRAAAGTSARVRFVNQAQPGEVVGARGIPVQCPIHYNRRNQYGVIPCPGARTLAPV